MSKHIGTVGERLTLTAKLVGAYEFTTYFGYREQCNTIYTFTDAEENVYVWKTTSALGMDIEDAKGNWGFDGVHKGDTFTCKATVKEHGEYKGTPQTVLTRLKVSTISHVPTKAELDENKAKAQRASLKGKDFIWAMPYKQYKEHYSDCETVAGSCVKVGDVTEIEVIIREGRLVPSGVRGKHYSGYEFKAEDGGRVCYRAVSEENARKQLLKDYPQAQNWELYTVYKHGR